MPAVGAAKYWMNDPPRVEPLRLRRVVMLAAALCFATGDVLARHWQPPALLIAVTIVLLLASLWALPRTPRVAALPVFALWISIGCWCAQMQRPVPQQEELRAYADGLSREVLARVVRVRMLERTHEAADDPEASEKDWATEPGGWERERGDAVQSVDLDVSAIEHVTPDISTMRHAGGGVRVTVIGSALPLRCGNVVSVPLRLRIPESYRDPGAWSSGDALLAQGMSAMATVTSERVQVIRAEKPTLQCKLFAAQTWATARVERYVGSPANARLPHTMRLREEDAAMLEAMLFGDRSGLTHTLREGFERTGTFHLFVVSGLHVTLLAGVLMMLFRKLRLRESYAVILSLAITTAYAMLTGFGVPVQRALGMTAAYLLARCLSRESSALNALGIAATAVLVLDPRALFEASFQMTFLVIISAAGLAVPLRERLWGEYAQALGTMEAVDLDIALSPRLASFRVRLRMANELCAELLGERLRHVPVWWFRTVFAVGDGLIFGLAAEFCMVLPMAVYFHRAVLLGLPVNIVCLPLIALLLVAAIAAFCAMLLNPWIALLPAAFTAALLHAMRAVVDHAGRLSIADIRLPTPSTAALIAACAAMAFACWALRERQRLWVGAGTAAILVAPLVLLWPTRPLLHPGVMEVTALDVGQGDSLFVVSPEGKTLLVDAGGPVGRVSAADGWDVGEDVVAPYLWSRRIARLDAVLLTHAHSDHMGGMPAVLRDLRPRELWLGVQPQGSVAMRALLAEAQRLGVTLHWYRAGQSFDWGGLHTDVLAPEAGYTNPGGAVNDDSLVIRMAYGKASVLLEGDAEAPSEAAMLAHKRVTPVTLLKVAHHGSRTSTGEAFLAAAAPREAVISVGQHNTFGHPRADVLARLQAGDVKVYRTDRMGAETFLLSADGGISAAAAASNP